MLALIDTHREHVYYTPRPLSERDLKLMWRIDELHLQHPSFPPGNSVRLCHAHGVDRLVRNSLWKNRSPEQFYDALES